MSVRFSIGPVSREHIVRTSILVILLGTFLISFVLSFVLPVCFSIVSSCSSLGLSVLVSIFLLRVLCTFLGFYLHLLKGTGTAIATVVCYGWGDLMSSFGFYLERMRGCETIGTL